MFKVLCLLPMCLREHMFDAAIAFPYIFLIKYVFLVLSFRLKLGFSKQINETITE